MQLCKALKTGWSYVKNRKTIFRSAIIGFAAREANRHLSFL